MEYLLVDHHNIDHISLETDERNLCSPLFHTYSLKVEPINIENNILCRGLPLIATLAMQGTYVHIHTHTHIKTSLRITDFKKLFMKYIDLIEMLNI